MTDSFHCYVKELRPAMAFMNSTMPSTSHQVDDLPLVVAGGLIENWPFKLRVHKDKMLL